MAASEALLAVREIHTYYGDSYVLHGLSLELHAGRIVVILGRNGMGKTTLIRSIAGLTPPRRGDVIFAGRSFRGQPPYAISQAGVAIVPQGRRIFGSLSVRENLALPTSALAGRSRQGRAALASEASGQRGNSIVRAHSASEHARERADDTRPEAGSSARAALASEASGQRGHSIVRAPDTRPEPGSSAREAGRKHWDLAEVLAEFPQLAERLDNAGASLSGGEQQMLAIGRALMANPALILMDEPSEGLAPKLVQRVEEIMRSLRAHGHSILLVEQNLALAMSVADSIYVISSGRFVFHGTPEQLSQDAEILNSHLGVSSTQTH